MSSVGEKRVLLIELVSSGKRKRYVVQGRVRSELVEALEFVFLQKTGGPKLLYAALCFVTTKANSDFTNLIF